MPNTKMMDYWNSMREKRLKDILYIIKKEGKIKDEVLIAKIAVEPPYLNNFKAQEVLKNLKIAGKIQVDEKGMVSLCQ